MYYEEKRRDSPIIKKYNVVDSKEELLSLSECGFLCEPKYFKRGIDGALEDCYARKSVVEKLLRAQSLLPSKYRFKIFDAYRPIEVQQALWDEYRKKLKKENPDFSEEELDYRTSFFVSKPSYDLDNPSVHNTGGAIDLTLVDKDGDELDMGTSFDDFTNMAYSNFFENYCFNEEQMKIKNNRRFLFTAMARVGFTNLPTEWWHYDYGDYYWAYYSNRLPLYKGLNYTTTHD